MEGLANRHIAMENNNNHPEIFLGPGSSKSAVAEEFANNLNSLRLDVRQLIDVCNEIGTEFGLRFDSVAGRLGRLEAHMATVLGNVQRPSSRICPRKAK